MLSRLIISIGFVTIVLGQPTFTAHTIDGGYGSHMDAYPIDLDLDDRHLLPQIQEIFEDTQLGWFKSSVHVGSNLRDFMEVSWS